MVANLLHQRQFVVRPIERETCARLQRFAIGLTSVHRLKAPLTFVDRNATFVLAALSFAGHVSAKCLFRDRHTGRIVQRRPTSKRWRGGGERPRVHHDRREHVRQADQEVLRLLISAELAHRSIEIIELHYRLAEAKYVSMRTRRAVLSFLNEHRFSCLVVLFSSFAPFSTSSSIRS